MSACFKKGSRGIFIRELQKRLSRRADGSFGPDTQAAVMAAQRSFGLDPDGCADEPLYEALHIPWPSQFERCLNLTCVFEGTGYGDMNATDIDGAGITLGIIGFTSKHGEVQALIRTYLRSNPDAYDALTNGWREIMKGLVRPESKPHEWENHFYRGDGHLNPQIKAAVKMWGEDPAFQKLQRRVARDQFWVKSVGDAQKLNLQTMAGYGLMFDISVQNGGWASRHETLYRKISQDGTEESKLRAIATAVADAANPKWRNDVIKRKMVFAVGAGTVHGIHVDLDCYAFEM